MDQLQTTPTDDFDLLYMLNRHGWSTLVVRVPDRELTLRIAHVVHDPISLMIGFAQELLAGAANATLVLYDEPGVTVLVASVDPDQRHIVEVEIWDCEGWNERPPNGRELLKARLYKRQLIGLIYRQLDKVRWLLENKNYQRGRGLFPLAAFEHLRAAMDGGRCAPWPPP